jgi:hypothetical protein
MKMDTTIIAYIAPNRTSCEYKKILTLGEPVYVLPDTLASSIPYSTDTLNDDDEWYYLDSFREKPYCISLLKSQNIFSSVDYVSLEKSEFGLLEYLCAYQDGIFYFQRVTPGKQIKKKAIVFGDVCSYEDNLASITINPYADAIFNPAQNRLYFRKLRFLTGIFEGIEEIYRIATQEEVDEFLSLDFVETVEYTSAYVKTNNRKRIAVALDILKQYSQDERAKIFDYIKDYCPDLATEHGTFIISIEDDLKNLLFGIEQRFYTTPVGGEKRIANSIIPIIKQEAVSAV